MYYNKLECLSLSVTSTLVQSKPTLSLESLEGLHLGRLLFFVEVLNYSGGDWQSNTLAYYDKDLTQQKQFSTGLAQVLLSYCVY
jgi:hypothetical protein